MRTFVLILKLIPSSPPSTSDAGNIDGSLRAGILFSICSLSLESEFCELEIV